MSLTVNVCANGSSSSSNVLPVTIDSDPSLLLEILSLMILWSATLNLSICGTLVLKIVSCVVSNTPAEAKFASADPVTVPLKVEFVELVVKRSVFVPVSNLGLASIFGFGIS